MSDITWVNKNLSIQGYMSNNFETTARNILSFRRTIVHIDTMKDLKLFFKEIKIPIRVVSIINYPEYMKQLFQDGINAINYRVVYVPKNIGIPVIEIKEWAERARTYYRYRKKT